MTDLTLIPIRDIKSESAKERFDTPYIAIIGGEWEMLHPFYGDFMSSSQTIFTHDEIDELYKLPCANQVIDQEGVK